MDLPRDSVGISDLLQYRDCPRRFEYGMRRHSGQEPPESQSPASAYGSAIHEAMHLLGQGATEREAVEGAFAKYIQWLDPSDVERLHKDIEIYLSRDQSGVELLMSEDEARVPLFTYKGRTIYFRFKLDRLYRRLDNPTHFLHIDYKSSKWAKSDEEVHEDPQQWSYNWAIHELYPEIETLDQFFDQLNYGQIPTSKSPRQREQIKEWLILAATRVLEDDELEPTFNEWCPWCPIKMDCKVIPTLTEYSLSRIAALAPRKPKLKKDGTESKVLGPPELLEDHFDEYVAELDDVATARKTLEAFEKEVREVIKQMPESRRDEAGYALNQKGAKHFTAEAMSYLYEELGSALWAIVKPSLAAAERLFGKDDWRTQMLEEQATEGDGAIEVRKKRS